MAETMWKLPFGKYINKDIEDVPDSYLIWITGEDWFKKKFAKQRIIINKELKYREQFDKHIEG